jgi:hypothetical protein
MTGGRKQEDGGVRKFLDFQWWQGRMEAGERKKDEV